MGTFEDIFRQRDVQKVNIKATIHEHRAPTDESVKLLKEMQDETLKNIIAHVKVENNLVNGEGFAIDQCWNINHVKLIFKFKINGQEFTLEREISRGELMDKDNYQDHFKIEQKIKDRLTATMLWYVMKKLQVELYEQITGTKVPEYITK